MKVTQAYEIVNNVAKQVLGETEVTVIDQSNLVDIGAKFDSLELTDKYVKALINHIGKVVFDTRVYKGTAPSIYMDGTEYGSIVEKIRGEAPDAVENKSWSLTNGLDYGDHHFYQPTVKAKFFNQMDTWEIRMSFGYLQVKQSFSSESQMTAFFTMIENKIRTATTIRSEGLIRSTINNMMAGTIYESFGGKDALNAGSHVRARNLLYEFKVRNPNSTITASTCLFDKDFLQYAAYAMKQASDRLQSASKLFNVGGTLKYTPVEFQKIILLSEFARAADVYLQSSTFHNEFVKLPDADVVTYWQGTGTDYAFDKTSYIHINTLNPEGDNTTIEVAAGGILGTIFDREAMGVTNLNQRVRTVDVPNAEFYTNFYKQDARYFNDYDENMIVFFVA